MTPKQLFERLRDWLQTITWSGTSNKIFGDAVHIVPEVPIQQLARFRSPVAFLVDQGFVCDPDHPGVVTQNFSLVVFVENLNDPYGECAMIGANRVASTSTGAGILDIEDAILDQIFNITELTAKLMLVEKSAAKQQKVAGSNYPSVMRTFSFSCLLGLY
ncbi:MAG: hypothetical protein DRI56_03225 [Chloroflexota bacterium]|nr:MAG: hypothetical protein DRI56_03225 [Chloroflexota bacterium]